MRPPPAIVANVVSRAQVEGKLTLFTKTRSHAQGNIGNILADDGQAQSQHRARRTWTRPVLVEHPVAATP